RATVVRWDQCDPNPSPFHIRSSSPRRGKVGKGLANLPPSRSPPHCDTKHAAPYLRDSCKTHKDDGPGRGGLGERRGSANSYSSPVVAVVGALLTASARHRSALLHCTPRITSFAEQTGAGGMEGRRTRQRRISP